MLYLCIAALLIDALLSVFPMPARIVGALAIAAMSWLPAYHASTKCATSMGRVAAAAAAEATPRDLVIVYPWYCGVSFSEYYRGAAPWTTLPSMADHTLHRYDLAKAAADLRWSGGIAATLRPYPRRVVVPYAPNVSEYERVALFVFSPE